MIKFGLCCGIWRANISRYIGLSIYWSGSSFHSHSICLVSWIHFCVSSDTWTRCCLTNTFSCLLDVCLISHAIQTFLIAVFLRLRPCSINPAWCRCMILNGLLCLLISGTLTFSRLLSSYYNVWPINQCIAFWAVVFMCSWSMCLRRQPKLHLLLFSLIWCQSALCSLSRMCLEKMLFCLEKVSHSYLSTCLPSDWREKMLGRKGERTQMVFDKIRVEMRAEWNGKRGDGR